MWLRADLKGASYTEGQDLPDSTEMMLDSDM
jgi:hypothetical protein